MVLLCLAELERYLAAQRAYDLARLQYRNDRGDLDARLDALRKQRQSLCGSQSPEEVAQVEGSYTGQYLKPHLK